MNLACKRRRDSAQDEGQSDWWRRLAYRGAFGIALVLVFPGGGYRVFAQVSTSSEYQVKAAFLFHFAQFVEWPSETFKDAASPLTYCTVGEDPFRGGLEAGWSGKTVGGRTIQVMHFKEIQETHGCQVVFLGIPEKKFVLTTLANLKTSPILTVGESENFAQQGGMIGFFLEDKKVRFEINLEAADRAKLKISARLLTLAKTVIGAPKGT